MNCLLEVRDVFAVMPTGVGKSFFSRVLQVTAIEQKKIKLRKTVSEQCGSSYLPVDRPD